MRAVNNKRARGRTGGRRTHNNANRSYESNGPDTKIRGTASQVYEKYCALARDAGANGDLIASENFQQHAEHYFRIMAASAEQSGQRSQARQNGHQQPTMEEPAANRQKSTPPPEVPPDPAEAEQPDVNAEAPAAG